MKGTQYMSTPKKTEPTSFSYKGHELIRKDDEMYYGNMADKYIVYMKILGTKTVAGAEMAGKIEINLQHTDPGIKARDRVVKKGERDGMYAAIDMASIWLDRALAGKI